MNFKTIKDVNIKNKNVLVRVDYNVPLQKGKITDDLRIRASIPTIELLLGGGAKKIFLISHLGRPDGQEDLSYSLLPVLDVLKEMLPGRKVVFSALPKQGEVIDAAPDAEIVLFENLRFNPGEEKNSEDFIKNIVDATNADVFIQDGFAVVHRAHASTDAIKKFLPVYAGLLVEKELENLEKVIKVPKKPLLLIIGGAKVDDKKPLIEALNKTADYIAVGGKIAADGYRTSDDKIYVAEDFDEDAEGNKLDIGPISTGKISEMISQAKTIIWNGLLGKAEDPAFATASTIVAELIGRKEDAVTVICGGDTTGFVENLMLEHPDLHYSLVSTGGGAALEYLSGKRLPGIDAILKA